MTGKALPLLLLGGAAAAYYAMQKPKKAVSGGKGSPVKASGTEGVIAWRVVQVGTDTYVAQWKRPKETAWRDAAEFSSPKEAADAIVAAIKAGDIP